MRVSTMQTVTHRVVQHGAVGGTVVHSTILSLTAGLRGQLGSSSFLPGPRGVHVPPVCVVVDTTALML